MVFLTEEFNEETIARMAEALELACMLMPAEMESYAARKHVAERIADCARKHPAERKELLTAARSAVAEMAIRIVESG